MRKVLFFLFLIGVPPVIEGRSIDLESAWHCVLTSSPALGAANAEICSLQQEAYQASLMLNPLLEVESENLGISRPSDRVEPPQTTVSLAQTLELGGKRGARYAVASSLSSIAYWDSQITLQNTFLELVVHFIQVRASQERLQIAEKKLSVAQAILESVHKQVENGKCSPLAQKKAHIALMEEELSCEEAFLAYQEAKVALSSMWGSTCPDFDDVIFELFNFSALPCESLFLNGFYQTPDYQRAQAAISMASKNVRLQRANSVPDVTVALGYRVFHDANRGALVVGAAMPLPFYNRNQGGIGSAVSQLSQAEFELEEVTRSMLEQIALFYKRALTSCEQTTIIQCGILREAQETVEFTAAGYESGKFDYRALLEAQEMCLDIQERYVDVLTKYHLSRAELSRLSGIKL